MSKKNFYDDILEICKFLDKQEGNKFPAWQFRFEVASEIATPNLKGSWRLDDESGGVHYFEFHDPKHLYYKNSNMENPLLMLKKVEDSEIKKIVDDMIANFKEGKNYTPFPDEKRRIVSPLPGFAWLKEE